MKAERPSPAGTEKGQKSRCPSVKDRTAEEYRDAFIGRLEALGKIQDITAEGDMAELPALARGILEPYMERRGAVMLEKGPHVSLSVSQARALGMILHELATNALKYGALSAPDGLVTIVWNVDDEEDEASAVNLRWRESNGPKVSPPASSGFGTKRLCPLRWCRRPRAEPPA